MNQKHLLLTVWLVFIGYFVMAQPTVVNGKVLCFKAYGLNKVHIKAKKSGAETFTDSLGQFSIEVDMPDVLTLRAKGFEKGVIYTQGEKEYGFNMIYFSSDWSYEQVLKNNYLSKEKLDYAIKNLSGNNNNYDRLSDIFAVIQSEYPPAKVDLHNGRKTIFLNARGATSVFAAQNALLVVDGIIVQDISGISPAQVEKVKVLMGVETSFYGTRGANGVVELTLKKD
ncbi:MAG: TonB-dependent receptor plug domain-containing protein [Cyclobacteriaceae bacterium]